MEQKLFRPNPMKELEGTRTSFPLFDWIEVFYLQCLHSIMV
ncbi:MAG: hypothetical protein K0S47_1282 [Herbinix sp.]|jgi:hypothetical protein|nr:hypothetical protein [Herbinix sp.]